MAATKKYTLTTNHTKGTKKIQDSFATEDAERTEKIQIHFTMKNMKLMK